MAPTSAPLPRERPGALTCSESISSRRTFRVSRSACNSTLSCLLSSATSLPTIHLPGLVHVLGPSPGDSRMVMVVESSWRIRAMSGWEGSGAGAVMSRICSPGTNSAFALPGDDTRMTTTAALHAARHIGPPFLRSDTAHHGLGSDLASRRNAAVMPEGGRPSPGRVASKRINDLGGCRVSRLAVVPDRWPVAGHLGLYRPTVVLHLRGDMASDSARDAGRRGRPRHPRRPNLPRSPASGSARRLMNHDRATREPLAAGRSHHKIDAAGHCPGIPHERSPAGLENPLVQA